MLKGQAKDKIRNGIALLAVAGVIFFFSRSFFYDFILGPHPMYLIEVKRGGKPKAKAGDHVIVSGRAVRLSVSEYIEGAYVSMQRQMDIDYTQTDYYLLIGPASEIFMKSGGMQKLAPDSSVESVYGKFTGILRDVDENSEEGKALAEAFNGPEPQRPTKMLDCKADTTMPIFFAWLLLGIIGLLALRGMYLIIRGWIRLRQP